MTTDPQRPVPGARPEPSDGLQSLQVDGVPVLWAAGPAPLSAGLVFGVGRRDETFLRGGLTHLVEHLVMRALGRTTLDCNASVDLTTTEFTATGRPEQVVDFLRRVCEALHALPVDRLSVEADVLRTEGGTVVHPAVGALLAERYGGTGFGLAGYGEPALTALTAADVQHWAATHFVRGSAVLWLSGPPPEGLTLPLPDGRAPVRIAQPLRPLATPALVEQPVDGVVAVGGEVPSSAGLAAACRVLSDRLKDDLRHRRGLSYTVSLDLVAIDPDRRFVAVRADCRDGQEARAARALWREVRRFADEGPTEEELAHDREALAEHLADPRAVVGELRAAAGALLTGEEHRTAEQLLQEASSVSAEQVRAAAAAFRDGALLGVPYGVEPTVPGVALLQPEQSELVGQTYERRRGSDQLKGARLVVGDEGVSVDHGFAGPMTVRYADALGLLELAPGEWMLVGAAGVSLTVSAEDWQDGAAALDRLRAAVPADLQVESAALGTDARRLVLVHAPPYTAAEALWPSRSDAWLLQQDSWTVVVREQDEAGQYAAAAGVSGALGKRGAVLVLEQAHDELSVVVLHRGEERDRHLWTGDEHDPSVLAELLAADADAVAALLADPGAPADVLAAMTRLLGVPEQVAQVLAGVPVAQVPGFVHEPARSLRQTFTATMRGEYDPPDSRQFLHRLNRLERERPPAYRAVNAALAAAQAAVAVVLASPADGTRSRRRTGLVAFFAVGALGNLWSVRPPRRTPS